MNSFSYISLYVIISEIKLRLLYVVASLLLVYIYLYYVNYNLLIYFIFNSIYYKSFYIYKLLDFINIKDTINSSYLESVEEDVYYPISEIGMPIDNINMYYNIIVIFITFFLLIPLIVYHISQFFRPMLYSNEQIKYLELASIFLLFSSVYFTSYVLFPSYFMQQLSYSNKYLIFEIDISFDIINFFFLFIYTNLYNYVLFLFSYLYLFYSSSYNLYTYKNRYIYILLIIIFIFNPLDILVSSLIFIFFFIMLIKEVTIYISININYLNAY